MAENAIVLYFSTKPAAQPGYDDNASLHFGHMVDDDYWFQQVAWSATVYSQPAVYDEPELSINEVNAGAAGGTQLVFSISVRPAQQPYADDEQIPVQYGLTDDFYILRFRPAGPKAMPPTVVQAEDDLPPQTHFGLEDEFHLGQLLYWVRPPAAQQPAGDDGDLGHPNIEDDTAPPSMLVALVAPTLPVLYQLEDDLPRNIAAHPLDDDINDLSLRIVLPYAAMPQPFASNEETVRTIKVDEDYSYVASPWIWRLFGQPLDLLPQDDVLSLAPAPPAPGFRCMAVTVGWYNDQLYQPGDVFDILFAADFSDASVNYAGPAAATTQYGWMQQVPESTPLYSWQDSTIAPYTPAVDPKRRFVM